MPKFSSYEEAMEYRNETLAEEYYNDEKMEEEDEMAEFDRWYDEQQDEGAIKALEERNNGKN